MTDKEKLNRLMAEAMGWVCIRGSWFEEWIEGAGEYVDGKVVYSCENWNPAECIEQAMEMVDWLRDQGYDVHVELPANGCVSLSLLIALDVPSITYPQYEHCYTGYADTLQEAICQAVEAAKAVRDD